MIVADLITVLQGRNPEANLFIESSEGINSLVGIVEGTDPDDVTLVDSTVIPTEDAHQIAAPGACV